MEIDGRTELVGIVGYPIGYTMSPAIHNAAFRAADMNWLYIPLRVPPGHLERAFLGLRAIGMRGFNVTIPHKVEAAAYVDELRGEGKRLLAVNTVVRDGDRLLGYNTDVEGFAAFLSDEGIRVQGASVLLIGAGGAARAVSLALAAAGAASIHIMNRTPGRAEDLKALLKRETSLSEISTRTFDTEGSRVLEECDLVVNCTPLGGDGGEGPPIDCGLFARGQWVVDLRYAGGESPLLREASLRGARTANGEGMLVHQAAASFRLWTGEEPPTGEMHRALRRAVSAR